MRKKFIYFFYLLVTFFAMTTSVFAMEPVTTTISLEAPGIIEVKVTPVDNTPAISPDVIKFNKKGELNLSFNKPGIYQYSVKAVSKDTSDYTYDRKKEYLIMVSVSRNEETDVGQTTVVLSEKGKDGKLEKLIFDMKPVEKKETTPTPTPTSVPIVPLSVYRINTGVNQHLFANFAGVVLCVAGIILLIELKK